MDKEALIQKISEIAGPEGHTMLRMFKGEEGSITVQELEDPWAPQNEGLFSECGHAMSARVWHSNPEKAFDALVVFSTIEAVNDYAPGGMVCKHFPTAISIDDTKPLFVSVGYPYKEQIDGIIGFSGVVQEVLFEG